MKVYYINPDIIILIYLYLEIDCSSVFRYNFLLLLFRVVRIIIILLLKKESSLPKTEKPKVKSLGWLTLYTNE
jgi:hypothetical protein